MMPTKYVVVPQPDKLSAAHKVNKNYAIFVILNDSCNGTGTVYSLCEKVSSG